jgi:hypothetical protein
MNHYNYLKKDDIMISEDLRKRLTYRAYLMAFEEPNVDIMCSFVNDLMNQEYYDERFTKFVNPNRDDVIELRNEFKLILNQLDIKTPENAQEAFWNILKNDVENIVTGKNVFQDLNLAMDFVKDNYDIYPNTLNYVGDSIGVEVLYGLNDSYDDICCGTYTPEETMSLLGELKQLILAAAQKWLDRFDTVDKFIEHEQSIRNQVNNN